MKKARKMVILLTVMALFVTSLCSSNVYAGINQENGQYPYIMFANEINFVSEHVVVNGNYIRNSTEPMIDKQRSVIREFILNDDYQNNINSDETITLEQISNSNVGCVQDINIEQDVINTESVLYSEKGNVNIIATDVNLKGLIYAPEGKICITAKNVNLNVILISKEITIFADNITANTNQEMASFLGTEENQP